MVKDKRNKYLDFLKAISCIGVVFIHIPFPGKFGAVIGSLAGFAVPIFFMITGYYTVEYDSKELSKYLRHVIRITVEALLLFFLYFGAISFKNGQFLEWIVHIFSPMSIIKSLVFCCIDFAIPLWYLIALIEIVFLELIIRHSKVEVNLNNRLLVGCCLLIFGIAITVYVETMGYDWFWKMNFLTQGYCWYLIGSGLKESDVCMLEQLGSKILVAIICVGSIISIAPSLFDIKICFGGLGMSLNAIAMFILAIKKEGVSNRKIEHIGRYLSKDIYIAHVIVGGVLGYLSAWIGLPVNNFAYWFIHPICTVGFSIIYAQTVFVVKTKMKRE